MASDDQEQRAKLSHEVTAENIQDLVWKIDPMDVLIALVNGLQKKKDDNDGELSREDDKRHCELIDLMSYVEREKEGQLSDEGQLPESDQLTLIERQISEGLISGEAGNDLKRELLDQFEKATSPDTPAGEQYRKVYEIMRTFNPARKLTCG